MFSQDFCTAELMRHNFFFMYFYENFFGEFGGATNIAAKLLVKWLLLGK